MTHDIESNGYSSNPFATRFVSSGRLRFIGLDEGALDQLAETLIQQNGNGQIVGPHGVGKTTLTYELENRIAECSVVNTPFNFVRKTIGPRGAIRSVDGSRMLVLDDDEFPANQSASTQTVLVLDGYERLSWFQRIAVLKTCQRRRIGLLVTSHRVVWGVPKLVSLEPDIERFTSVVEALTADCEFELSSERLSQVFLENRGNVREALMSCYDEFEASRARTAC